MFFSGIEGHSELLVELEGKVLSGKMNGAFIFIGPKGVGKFKVASSVARYAACVGTQDDSCSCATCRNFNKDPDVMLVGDHDNSVIKADELLNVQSFLDSESHKGSKKVLVINDVDRLSNFAADDLLKVLEEPHGGRLIIFTSSFPEDIPGTLFSRVEKVSFSPLPTQTVVSILKKRGQTGTKIDELSKFSRFMLQSFLSDPDGYARQRDNSIKFLKFLKKMNEDSVLGLVEDIQAQDGDIGVIMFVEMVVMTLADISKIRMGSPIHIVNTSKIEVLEDMAQTWDDMIVLPISNIFTKIIAEYKADTTMSPKYRTFKAVSTAYNTVRVKMAKREKVDEHK